LSDRVTGKRVSFNWTGATDDRTPAAGLAYRFSLQAAASSSGNPRPFSFHALERGTSTFLDLPNGIYYWTVQAVDGAALAGSPAPEKRDRIA